jgi:hypothetical protein
MGVPLSKDGRNCALSRPWHGTTRSGSTRIGLRIAFATASAALLAGVTTGVPLSLAAARSHAAVPAPTNRRPPAVTATRVATVASGSTASSFSCATPTIFLSQGNPTQLYDSLYGAGSTTFAKIGTTHHWNYNALGYDAANKYLYAVSTPSSKKYPAGHLLKIANNGTVEDLGAITGDSYLTTDGATNGAFDGSNNFWVTSPGNAVVDEVDVASSPPKVTHKRTLSPAKGWAPSDFTWDGGFMWGLAPKGSKLDMYRINLSSGAISAFPAPAAIVFSPGFGAAWTYGNGNLGFDSNQTGALYQIAVTKPASSAPTFTVVSTYTGPKTTGDNDGAACVPTPTDLSITKTGPATVALAARITWTLKVTNHGPGISSGYVIDDPVPAGVTGVATTSPGCKAAGNAVTCTEGKLTVGSSASFTVTGDAPASVTCITNTATVIANEHNPNPKPSSSVKTCTEKSSPTLGDETPMPSSGPSGSSFADQVTLAGGSAPTGSITFALFGPSQPTCEGTPEQTVTTTVHGDATYTSSDVTIDPVGDYWWLATYGGDSANNEAATSCSAGIFTVTTPPPDSCTIKWVGPTSGGLWATSSNWNLDRTPTAGDVVCIGTSGTSFSGPVVFDGSNGTSDTSIDELNSYAPLEITGGELGITDTGTLASELSFVAGLTMTGGQLGDQTNDMAGITDTGTFTWTSGSFYAPSAESPQPVLKQTGGGAAEITDPDYVDNWNLSFDGPLTMPGGSFYFQDGGGITESAAATITGNVEITDTGSAGDFTLTGSGSLTMDASGDTGTIAVPFVLSGPVVATAGTLNLSTDGGTLGDFSAASGATVELSPGPSKLVTITASTVNSGAGTLVLTGDNGTIADDAALDVDNLTVSGSTTTADAGASMSGELLITNGELDPVGTNTFSVGGFDMSGGQLGDETVTTEGITDTGTFTWTNGSFYAPTAETPQPELKQTGGGAAEIVDPYYVDNWNLSFDGPLTIPTGDFYFENGGGITESAAATITGNVEILDDGSAGDFTLTGSGSLTMDASGDTGTIAVPLVNGGTVAAESGNLTITSLTNTGTLNIGTSRVTIQSAYSPAAGSVLDVAIDGTAAGTSYGQLVVDGTFSIAGTLDVTTGAAFTPTSGETFMIATYTAESGSFSTVSDTGYDAPAIDSTDIVLTAT